MTSSLPIAVLGAGPAGSALVAALTDVGEDVLWIAPDTPWRHNYGIWCDELAGTGLDGSIFETIWHTPIAATDLGIHTLDRAYGRIDNDSLQRSLSASAARATRVFARVEDVRWEPNVVAIETTDGTHRARFAFDATGHNPVATERRGSNPGFQTAYGILCEISGDPIDGHEMSLMDFRTFGEDDWDGPPTFLYAMRLPDRRWFLEETVLVARPATPIGDLRDRLYARLKARHVDVVRVDAEERCFIPMGDALPAPRPGVAAFGAAASFVHPATGYSIARSLRSARHVAAHVRDGLPGFGGETLTDRSTPVDSPVWPTDRLAARQYYRFGMETLLELRPEQTHAFFDAFFHLPEDQWQGYLSDTLEPRQIAKLMLALFGRLDLDMKAALAGSAFGDGQLRRLMKGLFGSL